MAPHAGCSTGLALVLVALLATPAGAARGAVVRASVVAVDARTATVAIDLAPGSARAVVVHWSTRAGTARAGRDYVGAAGRVVLSPARPSATVVVRLLPSPLSERSFTVRVSAPATVRGAPLVVVVRPAVTPATVALSGCPVFPSDNAWNTRVDTLPVDPRSAAWTAAIGLGGVHPDFGAGIWDGGPVGIPYVVVPPGQPMVPVRFRYAAESDPGPYPVPAEAPIEGGPASTGDRHVLVVDAATCRDYELYDAHRAADGSWDAGSGAVFDLRSNALRPDGWTSADAAGLPVLAGLVRYDEVASGAVRHALRFTAPRTLDAHQWPATHDASSRTDPALPPMGARFRLKASFDVSGYSPALQVVLTAMKTYGIVLADNGSPWYVSGAPDPRWDDDALHALGSVTGADFEAVDVSSLVQSPTSGAARQP